MKASGDTQFLQTHREAVEKAWHFETAHDTDGDGIYDNSQGTGWVEDWRNHVMPHQEIYLALFDQQASEAMVQLAEWLGDKTMAAEAAQRAKQLKEKIETEYYDPSTQSYAFSRNADGTTDRAATLYPTVAWWGAGQGLAHAGASFRRWASHDFSTDWGTRDVAESDPLYDPISYHMGSVWPLFTGWTAMAEYKTGRTLAGFAHLMQNADQTTTQDLGGVTELLSGAYFQPFGRSTSHQLWSSAMVVVPSLRGLFGIEVDGKAGIVQLSPRLPADWNEAHVDRLHVGSSICSLDYIREGAVLKVRSRTLEGTPVKLAGDAARTTDGSLQFRLPQVEVAVSHGLPLPGATTAQMKVLAETHESRSLKLELEGMAGTVASIKVRRNDGKIKLIAEGATVTQGANGVESMQVRFPDGVGYQPQTVVLRW